MKTKPMKIALLIFLSSLLAQGFFLTEGVLGKSGEKSGKVRILEEQGPEGHTTIGIDESSIADDAGKATPVHFSTLMEWDYDRDRKNPPPESVGNLDGKKIRIIGFMYPLQDGQSIQYFCLLRSTQTCCYGPRPQFNQYILVEMDKPTEFFRLDPVSCEGAFHVDPTPDEGFIYRMEGKACKAVQ